MILLHNSLNDLTVIWYFLKCIYSYGNTLELIQFFCLIRLYRYYKNDFAASFFKRFNCYLIFLKMHLFLWHHFEINSVYLLNKFLWLALTITNSSLLNKDYTFLTHIWMLRHKLWHSILPWSWFFSLVVSRCVLKVLSCSSCRWQNEFVWLLYGDLNSPSLAP